MILMQTNSSSAELTIGERVAMLRGMFNPGLFKSTVRPMLYRKSNDDPELVHELTMKLMAQNESSLKMVSILFGHRRGLRININGKDVIPFGTAAGLDKNGDAMKSLSNFFGFLEPGTVVVNPREGNKRPRVAFDSDGLDVYNAQGFPSKGLEYFKERIIAYRRSNYKAPVYVSICGLPISEQNAVDVAMDELTTLLKSLNQYVDGFVWNCFSPNTSALKMLRTPEIFEQSASLMKQHAPDKLRLVKLGPYEEAEKDASMSLIRKFMDGGGHGVVTTNTKMVPKEQVPAPDWGYPSAGRSGKFLKPYRLRSVSEIRAAFPDSVIVATGGIYDGDDAYETFKAGADMLEGYTPYGFYGIGLLRNIEKGVVARLKQDGYRNLTELREKRRRA